MSKKSPTGELVSSTICRVSSAEEFRVSIFKRAKRGANGEETTIEISSTVDGGRTWEKVPLRRSFRSFLISCVYSTWPPEGYDKVEAEGGFLSVEYRDMWVPHEPSPAWRWKAVYDPAKGYWTLARLQKMDYENKDAPAPYAIPKHGRSQP